MSIEVSAAMTAAELEQYEGVIERGIKTFVEVGGALMEIRDRRGYRFEFKTFEDYCQKRWGLKQSQAYRLMDAAQVVVNLKSSPIGELPATESQARPLAALEPDQQVEAWQRAVETAPNGKVTAAHVQSVADEIRFQSQAPAAPVLVSDSPRPHVAHNSGNNEWYTPAEYIDAARAVMGGIDTDPASSDVANRIVKAKRHYTMDDDGLARDWRGRVWMNPPYSADLVRRFAEKYVEQVQMRNVEEGIVLVNNATETEWFALLVSVSRAVCFPRSRIRYLDETGKPANTPLQGQAFVYSGKNVKRFIEVFGEIGWCATL